MSDPYAVVADTVKWLDSQNGSGAVEQGLRILKVAEEAGEVASAWIGLVGQNPRKGLTHTVDQVAAELADVAFTALVAMKSLGHDPDTEMRRVATKVAARLTEQSKEKS